MPRPHLICLIQMVSLDLVRAMRHVLEMTRLIDMGRDLFVRDMSYSYMTYLV